ncbi:hypothetical protein JTY60_02045 [symbiont of Argiope bruennichi]|uniref:hypothetical protein n=1 Tax=symbiont of Argiope bruennichi TaxID=2810479 RepID=UPI003DA31455
MFEIEKLENNIVDLVEILNDRELLKLDKFKNIYQINKKINNNLNNFLSGLNLRKIKNLSEVKVKINLNLNYFKNFSFIKEKYNLNEIFELSFEEQKKLNNKILKELISYFNKKKYEIPSVIWLGYQDEKKCNNLVQEIDFFSNNIENNFEIFFNKIQKFNNIEKTNAINFYQKTLNKFSDNDLIKNKLLKINKNFFSFDEYLLFKDNLDDNFDESMLSDQSSNETELTLINNSIAIKDLVEELIVKKINLEELASVSEILPDENLKQLTIFTNKFIKETNNNINEKIILHYYPDSKSTKNFEDFSFYITDDIEDTIKKINQYFNKAETNIKITALEKMANFFNFSKQFTTLQKNINDFGTLKDVDNIKEFLKENATIQKLLEKTPYYHLLESFNYNSTDKKEDIYSEIFENYNNNIDFDNFFTAETFRTIISGINDHLNHNTIIKYYNNEQKEKFSSLIYEINTQVRDNFSENIDDNLKKPVEHLKNTSSDLVYKNLNNEDILNFFRLFSNNGVEEDDFNTLNNNFTFLSISTAIDKLIAKKINNIFTEVLNYSNFEINKYRHLDNIEKFWNDQKNQDRINNFVNNNKDPYEWNKLNRFQFQIWKDLKEIEKINKIFINNYLDQKQLLPPVDFKNKLDTLFLILTKYKLIKDWNFDMAYIKFQKLIASVFTIEINKTFFGVISNEINIRNEIVNFLNIPKNNLPHEKLLKKETNYLINLKSIFTILMELLIHFFFHKKKKLMQKLVKLNFHMKL